MSDVKTTGTAGCAALVLLAPLTIYHALMFSRLWQWFVVPSFHAPLLTVTQSVGLFAILFFVKGYNKNHKFDDEDASGQIAELLSPSISYSIAFVIGYVAHLYT